VPISNAFREALLQKKAEAKTEFLIEYHGKQMKKFRRSFRTACTRAKLTYPCRFYDVRHLFATVMLTGGGDLAAVSKMLGHSSTQQTANTYYELLSGEKERAIGLLPDVFSTVQKKPDSGSIRKEKRKSVSVQEHGPKKILPFQRAS